MAAPLADKVLLPSDTGNAGKKVRTQTRVVGADTVHEHFFVTARGAQVLGIYQATLAQITAVAAAQNGTSTGSLWLHVPTAITNKKVRIRRVIFSAQHATAFAGVSAPRLAFSRMTFTGTASGAQVTGIKCDTTMPSAVADLRTAVTGLTPTLVGTLAAAPFGGALTAVGAYTATPFDLIQSDSEDDWWVFAPGEGLAIWQDTAGTTSDTRVANLTLAWDEIDTA
jgi:hypothetical protein